MRGSRKTWRCRTGRHKKCRRTFSCSCDCHDIAIWRALQKAFKEITGADLPERNIDE